MNKGQLRVGQIWSHLDRDFFDSESVTVRGYRVTAVTVDTVGGSVRAVLEDVKSEGIPGSWTVSYNLNHGFGYNWTLIEDPHGE